MGTIYHDLAAMLEVYGESSADVRLDLAEPPVLAGGVADEDAGGQMFGHARLPGGMS
jgi:hypothetical protein